MTSTQGFPADVGQPGCGGGAVRAKQLTKPTGRPVRTFGPTGGSHVHADPRDWENDPWQPDERSSQVDRKPFVPRPRAIWDVRRREDVRPVGEGVA